MNNNRWCPENITSEKYILLKMANISQQHVKTASKNSYLTYQSWGLVTFDCNVKKAAE